MGQDLRRLQVTRVSGDFEEAEPALARWKSLSQSLPRNALRIVASLFVVLSVTVQARGEEFRFCTTDDLGAIGNIRVLGARSKKDARLAAESQFCSRNCTSVVCSGVDFKQQECGSNPESKIDLRKAQSKMFCESADGSSRPKTVRAQIEIALLPGVSKAAMKVASVLRVANQILSRNQCPLLLEPAAVTEMPSAFRDFRIYDEKTLKLVARYPGDVKFSSGLSYCGGGRSTLTLDGAGQDRFLQCTLTKFYTTIIVADEDPTGAVLLLRGLAHMAGVEESTDPGLAYTLADPDLLIPASPLLEGKIDRLGVTKGQCVAMARYARQLGEMSAITAR